MSVKILVGDCREILQTLPTESVHTVVTSPPYWGLRDYGVAGQIGLEETPERFTAEMVDVFRAVRRVLHVDGTCWLNLGDSYASTPPGNRTKGVEKWATSGLAGAKSAAYCDTLDRSVGQRRNTIVGNLKPKDLCGIPWRVAFALQAPDYLGRISNETDRAWLAALVDGEGCISILETTSGRESGPLSTSYPPILQVRMCDRECIDKAMQLVGSTSENPPQYPASQGGVRPAFQWRIHGRKAVDTIAEIYPFLLIKRKQAIVAWNHQAAREGYETKRGVKVPEAAVEKQKLCREIIQKLNQREPVDLPSWMIEPPQPYGPGWYLRQDLIWSKPNPMPESVRDRCTKAHEYLFLLSKSERYYFDAPAISEPAAGTNDHDLTGPGYSAPGQTAQNGNRGTWKGSTFDGPRDLAVRPDTGRNRGRASGNKSHKAVTEYERSDSEEHRTKAGLLAISATAYATRNRRSVWTVATAPFSEAHFATFPPALIEPCILAGCPKGGTVLDPFGGAGTTGLVADRLGRNATLIELNPEYVAMAERRIRGDAPLFTEVQR